MAGALAEVRDREAPSLLVFVELAGDPGDDGHALLARFGVASSGAPGPATAVLSPQQVEELSEQRWVRFLRLSRPLRLA